MIGEEASIALCYSGEAALAMAENDNLDYSVPKEGSNLWIEVWTGKKLLFKFTHRSPPPFHRKIPAYA